MQNEPSTRIEEYFAEGLAQRKSRTPRNETIVEACSRPVASVPVGARVVVGLRGGGAVDGLLARRVSRGIVLRPDDGGEIVVLEAATSGARVVQQR